MPDSTDTAPLWTLARRRGIGRRRFLQLLVAGGATAVLAACGADDGAGKQSGWFKDADPFIRHEDGKSLEARLGTDGWANYPHLALLRPQQLRQRRCGRRRLAPLH